MQQKFLQLLTEQYDFEFVAAPVDFSWNELDK